MFENLSQVPFLTDVPHYRVISVVPALTTPRGQLLTDLEQQFVALREVSNERFRKTLGRFQKTVLAA
jgi:hypothetical protein